MKRSKIKKAIRAGITLLGDTLDKLPDNLADEIWAKIVDTYEEAAAELNAPKLAERLLWEAYAKELIKRNPGQPRKPGAEIIGVETLHRICPRNDELLRLKRIFEEMKKPSEAAFIFVALEQLGRINSSDTTKPNFCAASDFFKMAKHYGKERAGSPRTYTAALNRLRRTAKLRTADEIKLNAIKRELTSVDITKEATLLYNNGNFTPKN